MQNEKGISLIEVVVGMLILSVLVTAMMKSMDQNMKGQLRARNDLRATTLAKEKLEELKNSARQSVLAGTFNMVTSTPMAIAFSVTQVATINQKAFTWSVSTTYVSLATSVTAPAASSVTTKAVQLNALVRWNEISVPRYITQSVLVTDFNQ